MIQIRKFIRILCVVVFLVSGYFLLDILVFSPAKTKSDVQSLKDMYYGNEDEPIDKRLEELRRINPEICGWIKIDDTNIDYPVLYRRGDTDYYLLHNYKGESTRYGSITLDARCEKGVDSKNVILHGHHMRDGQMFADLLKFGDADFCRDHALIQFDTTEARIKWKVFAVFKTNTLPEQGKLFDYCIANFPDKNDFMQYIVDVRRRSLIDFPTDVKYTDQLLTLSTCSYEYTDFRTVVVARKLRDNESEHLNVDKIKAAVNPLMPDCWDK